MWYRPPMSENTKGIIRDNNGKPVQVASLDDVDVVVTRAVTLQCAPPPGLSAAEAAAIEAREYAVSQRRIARRRGD